MLFTLFNFLKPAILIAISLSGVLYSNSPKYKTIAKNVFYVSLVLTLLLAFLFGFLIVAAILEYLLLN